MQHATTCQMTRKQLKLQSKPLNLLSLVPSQEQKQRPNPFEPSRLRMAMRKVAVTMEDMTERFEAWCEPTPGMPTLSLAERMQRWIGKSEPSTTALTIRQRADDAFPTLGAGRSVKLSSGSGIEPDMCSEP